MLLLAFLSFSAFADLGFYSPTDSKLPKATQDAADSVFEIRTGFIQDLENYSDVKVVDISTAAKKALILQKIEQMPDQRDQIVYRSFVAFCEKKSNTQECPLPESIANGSGFISGNGSKLWTNAHVVEKMVQTRAVTHEKSISDVLASKANFPIFVFDKTGKNVFNGLEQEISFADLPATTQLSKTSKSFYDVDNDYISITLPLSLGKPLEISPDAEKEGDQIYVMGYPYCTDCEDPSGSNDLSFENRYPYDNAEDCLQKVTIGEILSEEEFGNLAQVNSQLINLLDKDKFIASTADSQFGMSGGPILNSEGKVVGINAGSKALKKYDGLKIYSRGVRPPQFN